MLNVTPADPGLRTTVEVSCVAAPNVRAELLVVILPPSWIKVGGPAKLMALAKIAPVVISVPVEVRVTEVNSLRAAAIGQTVTVPDPALTFSTAPFELLRMAVPENVMAVLVDEKFDVAPALTLMLLTPPAV